MNIQFAHRDNTRKRLPNFLTQTFDRTALLLKQNPFATLFVQTKRLLCNKNKTTLTLS